jgi:hypothetical protein
MKRARGGCFLLSHIVIFVLAYIGCNVFVSFVSHTWSDVDPSLLSDTLGGLLHIGVYATGDQQPAFKSWSSDFTSASFSGGVHVLFDATKSLPSEPGIAFIEAGPGQGSPGALKRVKSASYFFYNTTAKWYIFVSDTTYVHIQNVKDMLIDLNEKYDALTQSVVLGSCIAQGSAAAFLDGAVGWLMSRKAVADFMKVADQWATSVSSADDVQFTLAMQRMKLSVRDAASPYFLRRVPVFNSSELPFCPTVGQILCKRCKPFLGQFNKVAFLKHGEAREPVTLENYPASVHWYMCGETPSFCRTE